jgi:carbonic anhydrase
MAPTVRDNRGAAQRLSRVFSEKTTMADSPKLEQSPIDLDASYPMRADFPADYFGLEWPSELRGYSEETEHGIEFRIHDAPQDAGIRLGRRFFRINRFHFHARSEHYLHGRQYPLETHVVHVSEDGLTQGIFGIMVEVGEGKPGADKFFRDLARQLEANKGLDRAARAKKFADEGDQVSIDPHDLLPVNQRDFYRYEGSLTTEIQADNPETVSWLIFPDTVKVSQATMDFYLRFKHAAKPLQTLKRGFVLTNFALPWGPRQSGT